LQEATGVIVENESDTGVHSVQLKCPCGNEELEGRNIITCMCCDVCVHQECVPPNDYYICDE